MQKNELNLKKIIKTKPHKSTNEDYISRNKIKKYITWILVGVIMTTVLYVIVMAVMKKFWG